MVGAVAHRPYRFSGRFDQVLVLGKEGLVNRYGY
jgi:hypothetical protein